MLVKLISVGKKVPDSYNPIQIQISSWRRYQMETFST